jgi:hypothetical protein
MYIKILGHLIITPDNYYSFADEGAIWPLFYANSITAIEIARTFSPKAETSIDPTTFNFQLSTLHGIVILFNVTSPLKYYYRHVN